MSAPEQLTGIWSSSVHANHADDRDARIAELERQLAEALAEVQALKAERDDCAIYLKDGETPRQRMDRDHADILALMEMLAKDRARREAAEAREVKLLGWPQKADEHAGLVGHRSCSGRPDGGNDGEGWAGSCSSLEAAKAAAQADYTARILSALKETP